MFSPVSRKQRITDKGFKIYRDASRALLLLARIGPAKLLLLFFFAPIDPLSVTLERRIKGG